MPEVTYFLPNTDSEVRVTIKDVDGTAITSGTATASVRSPDGTSIATGVGVTHIASGVWKLPVDASWSFDGTSYTLGEFTAIITVSYSGKTLTKRVRWPVAWDDKT